MTPLQIQMMLHYYTTPKPYALREPEHAGSDAVRHQRKVLVENELLRCVCGNESGYEVTERGTAYLEALTEVPWPVCKWVIPELRNA